MVGVLELDPESQQLRQVARAYAAGEISREDYRTIRAALLEARAGGAAPEAAVGDARPLGPQVSSDTLTSMRALVERESPRALLGWLVGGAIGLLVLLGALLALL